MSGERRNRGFTLVEMLVVLSIAAILVTFGSAGLRHVLLTQRIKSASFDLYATLTYARSEAITRNASGTITPVSGSWTSGWAVTDAASATLRSNQATPGITITGPATVSYNAMGRLTSAVSSFSISASGIGGSDVRCITIDLSGRPTVKSEACT